MLVLADREAPWERLITDLVLLGCQPFVHSENGSPMPVERAPAVAVILAEDVPNHAVPASELGVRLALLRHRFAEDLDDVLRRGPLALNPLTYQVPLEGGRSTSRSWSTSYKLLMGYPGRVYTREEILSLVWGYDYFGGMRPWTCTCAASARSSATITRG